MAVVQTIAPDHALDAEDAVVAALIAEPAIWEGLRLEVGQFFSAGHRRVVEAVLHLRDQAGGAELDATLLADHLRRRGHLADVGGLGGLARLLEATPAVSDLGPHARIVREAAEVRRLEAVLASAKARCRGTIADRRSLLAEVRAEVEAATEGRGPEAAGLELVDVGSVPAEMPPVPYLSPRLGFAPGRPCCLVGYAGAGKTMLAADLALGVSAPEGMAATCWGGLPVERRGRVVMIDLEVGDYLTKQRLTDLAHGRWAQLAQWSGRLAFACFPRWSLVSPGAEERLEATIKGAALCIIDSLTMLLGGQDENASSVADCIGLLARVSERTGCAILVLHHEGKPPADGPKAAHLRGRGSSAIQGMWSSQWAVASLGEGRLKLEHGKNQWGPLLESHSCQIADLTDEDGRKVGVRLAPLSTPQDGPGAAAPAGALAAAKRQAVEALGAFGEMTGEALAKAIKAGKDTKYRAIKDLTSEGVIVRRQDGKGVKFSLPGKVSLPGKAARETFEGEEGNQW